VTADYAEHLAEVAWTPASMARGLPEVPEYVGPVHQPGVAPPWTHDAWSLICRFDPSPRDQGNPSRARVRFLFLAAPDSWLRPGSTLWLWEGPLHLATISVLD
jgi:hypothetical protein